MQFFAFCVLVVSAPLTLVAATPSAQQYYEHALSVMRALPQPSHVEATVIAEGHGIGVSIAPERPDGTTRFRAATGLADHRANWSEIYDGGKNSVLVDIGDGQQLRATNPILNPTWAGADDWLLYGLNGPATPATSLQPETSSKVKTIVTATAMAPSAYRVTDGGAAGCPDGSPGHRLHFEAIFDAARHPLTDAIVDAASQRFCMLKFTIDPAHIHGGTGTVELDFGIAIGFWLERQTHVNVVGRLFGIGVAHASVDVFYHVTAAR